MIYHKFVLFIEFKYILKTMQLKFTSKYTQRQNFTRSAIKILLFFVLITFIIFLLDKINFPSPEKNIKDNITNEVIKQ